MSADKVGPHHLGRKGIVYVRQSSAHQVLHNPESRALQYAMRDRLAALASGWNPFRMKMRGPGPSAARAFSPSLRWATKNVRAPAAASAGAATEMPSP